MLRPKKEVDEGSVCFLELWGLANPGQILVSAIPGWVLG